LFVFHFHFILRFPHNTHSRLFWNNMSINIATTNDLLEAFSKLRTCGSMVVIKHSDGSASFEPSSFQAEPGIDATKNKDSVGRSDTEVVDLVSPAKIKDPTGHSGAETFWWCRGCRLVGRGTAGS
jgi:hypothetical protein